ncbi:MAG: archaellin/type IV pilin N-terminal domain-containing protein [Candidatus Aenigmatarchaeota archaeon]
MKGISPLIATVLLIALTVSVAALVGTWLLGFARTSTQTVQQQADIEITCGNGGISFSDVCYSNGYLFGYLRNTGLIPLGKLNINILYTNGSSQKIYLSYAQGLVVPETSCCGNLTMLTGEKYSFNISVDSNYDIIYVLTNCTNKVSDEIKAWEIPNC